MTIGTVYSAAKKDLQSMAQWTQDQFTTLAASIATGWSVEHNGEGRHTSVTATQVRTGGLGLTGLYQPDILTLTSLAPLVVPDGMSVVTLNTTNPLSVYGIQKVGAQFGDILAIGAGASQVTLYALANGLIAPGTTPVGTELVWDDTVHAATTIVLAASSIRSPLLLMYLPKNGYQSAPTWTVLRGLLP